MTLLLTLNNYFLKYKGKNKGRTDQNQSKRVILGVKRSKKQYFSTFFRQMKSKKNLNISANNTEEPMEQLFLSFLGSDTKNQSILFEEINKELEAFFTKEFKRKT